MLAWKWLTINQPWNRNKSQHAARRKMQTHPYSQQAVDDNEALITEMAQRFLRRMMSNSGTVDVYPLCGLVGLEVICRAAFDHDIGAHSTEEALAFLHYMEDSAKTLPLSALFPPLSSYKLGSSYLGEFLPGIIGHAFSQRRRWEQTTRRLFQEFQHRSIEGTSERFLATPFLTQQDDFLGRKLSEDEAVEEAMGLAFAGSGTTSTTIVYILYHLSRPENRTMQKKVREELCATGSSLSDVRDLPYLNCVIKEAMRLNPSLIGTLPRTLLAPIDIHTSNGKGIKLPAGTTISMQNYVHQRDSSVYPEPQKFIPERWLGLQPSSPAEKAFTPFSLGPRNCLGQNLARAELLLTISTIFRQLSVRLNEDMKPSEMEMEDRFAATPVGKRLLLDVQEL